MKITRNQVSLEEHARSNNLVLPADGFAREDAINPESWVHVTSILRPMDKLSVLSADRTWYGEYIVLKSGDEEFALAETLYRDLTPAEEAETYSGGGYAVSWGGRSQRWRVKRLSDGKVLVSGMEKAEAEAWAASEAAKAKEAA
jgi:hypothetical protein